MIRYNFHAVKYIHSLLVIATYLLCIKQTVVERLYFIFMFYIFVVNVLLTVIDHTYEKVCMLSCNMRLLPTMPP